MTTKNLITIMAGVREYGEEMPVELSEGDGKVTITALVDAGHNSTSVDLRDLIAWLKTHRPDLLK